MFQGPVQLNNRMSDLVLTTSNRIKSILEDLNLSLILKVLVQLWHVVAYLAVNKDL